MSGVIY